MTDSQYRGLWPQMMTHFGYTYARIISFDLPNRCTCSSITTALIKAVLFVHCSSLCRSSAGFLPVKMLAH